MFVLMCARGGINEFDVLICHDLGEKGKINGSFETFLTLLEVKNGTVHF